MSWRLAKSNTLRQNASLASTARLVEAKRWPLWLRNQAATPLALVNFNT